MLSLHVVHVVLSLDVGGLERVVLDLVRSGTGTATIICLERPGRLAPEAEALGVNVVSLDKPAGLRPGLVRRITTILHELKPDVVHTHQIGALLYAGPAARRAKVPVVVHSEHGKHFSGRWRTRLLGRWAARYAKRFVCVSEDIRREVIHHRIVAEKKAFVIPNGIDVERFGLRAGREQLREQLGIALNEFVLGTVGRLNEIKRQDILIDAFARLAPQYLSARLLIVGDGTLRRDLETRAKSLGLTDRVVFAGYQRHPEPFYAAMDAFTLTSRSEGMPLSILEAWAAGLPVAASQVGGIPELLADGGGLTFPAGDVQATADVLQRLLANPASAAAIGERGRLIVRQRYDVSVMASAYDQSYRELLPLPFRS